MRAASRYQVPAPAAPPTASGRRRPPARRRPGARSDASTVGGEPGVAVQCQQRRGGGQHLVRRGRLHRHGRRPAPTAVSPVSASVIRPVNAPRFGSASVGAKRGGQPVGGGLGGGVGDRDRPRVRRSPARARRGRALASLWPSAVQQRRRRDHDAATSSSTATPITTWVDRRHRVGRMVLLTPAC